MEVNKDIYNLICLYHIAQIYNNDFKGHTLKCQIE